MRRADWGWELRHLRKLAKPLLSELGEAQKVKLPPQGLGGPVHIADLGCWLGSKAFRIPCKQCCLQEFQGGPGTAWQELPNPVTLKFHRWVPQPVRGPLSPPEPKEARSRRARGTVGGSGTPHTQPASLDTLSRPGRRLDLATSLLHLAGCIARVRLLHPRVLLGLSGAWHASSERAGHSVPGPEVPAWSRHHAHPSRAPSSSAPRGAAWRVLSHLVSQTGRKGGAT